MRVFLQGTSALQQLQQQQLQKQLLAQQLMLQQQVKLSCAIADISMRCNATSLTQPRVTA